jgi:hypothetical protein
VRIIGMNCIRGRVIVVSAPGNYRRIHRQAITRRKSFHI